MYFLFSRKKQLEYLNKKAHTTGEFFSPADFRKIPQVGRQNRVPVRKKKNFFTEEKQIHFVVVARAREYIFSEKLGRAIINRSDVEKRKQTRPSFRANPKKLFSPRFDRETSNAYFMTTEFNQLQVGRTRHDGSANVGLANRWIPIIID